jgi:hypothetical protein
MKQVARLALPVFLAVPLVALLLAAMATSADAAMEDPAQPPRAHRPHATSEPEADYVTVEISATDTGWYDDNGNHTPTVEAYSVGNVYSDQYTRNFFIFDLSSIARPIVSARLFATNPADGFSSPEPPETWTLFDVTTPVPTLVTGGSGQIGIYNDLGGGATYGATTVSLASNDTLVEVALNVAGITALNAARGSSFALGGAITTLDGDPGSEEYLFAFSGQPEHIQKLVLTLEAIPPEPPALASPADATVTGDMTPTLTWEASPSPYAAGYLLDWNGALEDVGNTTQYTTPVLADGVYTWTVAAHDGMGHVSAFPDPWSFTVEASLPGIDGTAPEHGATEVPLDAPVVITFSEPISTATLAYTVVPDPGDWSQIWSDGGIQAALEHGPFACYTTYTLRVTHAEDLAGKALSLPYEWTFTTEHCRVYVPLALRPLP